MIAVAGVASLTGVSVVAGVGIVVPVTVLPAGRIARARVAIGAGPGTAHLVMVVMSFVPAVDLVVMSCTHAGTIYPHRVYTNCRVPSRWITARGRSPTQP